MAISEDDYILVTNKSNLRVAEHVLRDCQFEEGTEQYKLWVEARNNVKKLVDYAFAKIGV
ncbi:MAG TPA: hypothetical protein VLA12_16715 [Planctomycetaceae bacterium]|nr:hypothetical protein [Planctomycetaceae bacterium]